MLHRTLLIFLIAAAPVLAEEKKKSPSQMTGKWEVVSGKFNGDEMPALKGRALVFGDKEFTTYDGQTKGRTVSFTLNSKTTPAGIDLVRDSDGSKALGIYTIEKDELKICYGEPGSARPTKFASTSGGKLFLLVLKRVNAK